MEASPHLGLVFSEEKYHFSWKLITLGPHQFLDQFDHLPTSDSMTWNPCINIVHSTTMVIGHHTFTAWCLLGQPLQDRGIFPSSFQRKLNDFFLWRCFKMFKLYLDQTLHSMWHNLNITYPCAIVLTYPHSYNAKPDVTSSNFELALVAVINSTPTQCLLARWKQ